MFSVEPLMSQGYLLDEICFMNVLHECAVPQVSPFRWDLYLAGKESSYNVGDLGSIPGLGRSPGEGKGYPLQYSGLENSMNCIVYGVAKSRT